MLKQIYHILTKKQRRFIKYNIIKTIRHWRNVITAIDKKTKIKFAVISGLSIIMLCIFLQALTLIYQASISSFLESEILKYSEYIKNDNENNKITYSTIESNSKIFGASILIKDVQIIKNDVTISIKSAQVSCDIISCFLKKIKLQTDISSEIKIGEKYNFLISFQKRPSITIKNTSDKFYIYGDLSEYVIFDSSDMKKIATVEKSKIMMDQFDTKNGRYLKIKSEFASKNIFDVDYKSENINTFFTDVGNLQIKIDINAFFDKIYNKIELKTLNINNLMLKTSDFKIASYGKIDNINQISPLNIDGKINIYQAEKLIDYLATAILNTSQNVNDHKMSRQVAARLHSGLLQKIAQSSDLESISLNITNNPNTKEIFINKIPIKEIIFDIIAYD